MRNAFGVTAILGLCLLLPHNSLAISVDLSGHVYEGNARDVVGPLSGVTVSLHVSNNAATVGAQTLSTSTDARGSYRLHLRDSGGAEYFNIVLSVPTGFSAVRSSSIGGSCMASDWIQYSLEQLMAGPTTDNDFYNLRENRPPTANDDNGTTGMDTPVSIAVLANDSDPDGDPITIIEVTDPPHGTVGQRRESLTYTPDTGYVGPDSFRYTISDGRGGTDTATVTIGVQAATSSTGEIRGRVFHDLDGDGQMTPGESGLEGWTAFLDDDVDRTAGPLERKTLTDARGQFVFSSLEPGTYRVDQVVEDGWEQIWPLGSRGEPVAWVLSVGAGAVTQADFGNIRAEALPDGEKLGLRLVRGPDVEPLSPRQVAVTWQTNIESTGMVRYGQIAGIYSHQAEDSVWAGGHRLVLAGLSPSTVYHFVLICRDPVGDQVTTRDLLFETPPEADRSPPMLTLDVPWRPTGIVIVSASAQDDTGIDRVVFFLDDDRVLTDYSPPYEAPVDTTPCTDGSHSVAAIAYDRAGKLTAVSKEISVNNHVEGMGPNVHITSHKTGDSVSGTIQVKADVSDDSGLWKAELYVDGDLVQQEIFSGPTPPTKATVQFALDTRQISKEIANDPHDIAVQAWDTTYLDGADAVRLYINNITPTPQYPWLKVIKHTASRVQNHLAISLVVQNQGTQTASNIVIRSGVAGFQVISGSSAQGQWVGRYDPKSRSGYCEIHSADIPVSAQRTYTYYAVPILHHPSPPPARIGHFIYLSYNGPPPVSQSYSSSDPWPMIQVASSGGTQVLQQAHESATGVCDYLLVTNPYRLYAMFNPGFYQGPTQATADVDGVLSRMAELAFHKQGSLGYNDQYDVASLVQLVHVGGAWSSRLVGGWTSNGYLLIVGETEVVPAQGKKFTYEYTGGTQVWEFVSDYRYASTSGDENWPELSIGRIIGNSASALGTALETSLGGKKFDRSHSLLVSGASGTGDSHIDFKSWVNGALKYLAGQFVPPVSVQTVLDQPSTAKLLANMANQDVIFLAGHGNADSWDGTTTTDVLAQASLFGTTSPFVFAHACKTGQYAGHYCLAEAFLDSGAAVYLGATDSAGWEQYSNLFFSQWGAGQSVGLAVKKTKQSMGNGFEDRLWSQAYHVFGDPKFGSSGTSSVQAAAAGTAVLSVADDGDWGPIEVELGDYEMSDVNGGLLLTLPGGQLLSTPPMPLVPYVTIRRSYPHDTQIQQVLLQGLSEPLVTTGVELARATMALPATGSGALTSGAEPEWWPERLFDWEVHETPTETVLALSVYPVRYKVQVGEVHFHQRLSFAVEAIASDVQITDMAAEDLVAQPGDNVYVEFSLANKGLAIDTVVQTVVLDAMTDEVRAGLPLRCLHELQGRGSYASWWDTTGVPVGLYVLRAELKSLDGLLLDSSVRTVELGFCDGRVSDLTVRPQSLRSGQALAIDAVIRNSGTRPLTGTAFLHINDRTGARLASFADDITDLARGESMPIHHFWQAPTAGSYSVLCYVLHEGKASEPISLEIGMGLGVDMVSPLLCPQPHLAPCPR